jgi:hypothetical protein
VIYATFLLFVVLGLFILALHALRPLRDRDTYVPECVEWFWSAVAWLVSRRPVAAWLLRRAMRTPYTHLPGYMNRYWLFNAYEKKNGQEVTPIRWLPSIRIHHILRKDDDRHLHDHPWNARTMILRGWYTEKRLQHQDDVSLNGYEVTVNARAEDEIHYLRTRGDTSRIGYGEYHSITSVSEGGVLTLFITFGYQGTWGFLVDGEKVNWRDYMGAYPEKPWASDSEPQS